MPEKIIIDTDPGVDDIMAMFFALQSPELEVLGLTTVFGGGLKADTALNAIRVVETAGRPDIPVVAGADRPLLLSRRREMGWPGHGEDRLGNMGDHLPQPKGRPIAKRAAEFIIETVMARPGEVTLVPIGPFTNIALALRLEPRLVQNVKQVVVMGGSAYRGGNASAVAEANIFNDPHAAKIVFEAGWPMVMAGLDVTWDYFALPALFEEIAALKTPVSDFISAIYPCYRDAQALPGGAIGIPDLHAVAYVVDPGLYRVRRMPVIVEAEGPLRGITAVDQRPFGPETPAVDVILGVDGPRLEALFKERIGKYR